MRDEGGGVLFSVRNDGKPIPAQLLPVIFEPFTEAAVHNERTSHRSLGLGLWIVHQIVVAHGGKIDVQSSAEEGTTFSVWLPRLAGEEPDARDAPS